MKLTDTVDSVLKEKGSQVIWSVTPEQSVYEAIEKMAEKEIGSLLVISEGKLVGILSEPDYARKVVLKDLVGKEFQVNESAHFGVLGFVHHAPASATELAPGSSAVRKLTAPRYASLSWR